MIYKMEDIEAIAKESVGMPKGMGDRELAKSSESWAPYLRFLGAIVEKYQPSVCLELGVYMGTATRHMALGCPRTKVIGVDKDFHPAVWDNVDGYENISLITGDSTLEDTKLAVFDALPGTEVIKSLIGLIFIDTIHDGITAKMEFELYQPLFADECLVVCDDLLGPEHLKIRMQKFWKWLPGEKKELHFLHPRLDTSTDEPGFGVSIVRREHA